jgi:uncharacterized protein
MYFAGQGVAQDFPQAVGWYRMAADQGFAAAELNLGLMYLNGQGLSQDYVRAHKWFNLAASRSLSGTAHDWAIKSRDDVAAKMTPAQIAQAQKMASEWKPK